MHHYPHHIGDFRKDTPHLSPSQKGIYRDLLDYAYATEKPLPDDLDMLSRVCGAVKPAERAMVNIILRQFFTRTKADDGWEHKRVIKEIIKFYAKSDAGKLGAASKHYGKPDAEETGKAGGKTPNEPTSNHKRARNQEPSTINHEPSTSGAASAFAGPDLDSNSSNSPQPDPDPILSATALADPSGKKEGGGIAYDVEAPEAWRVVNLALGRPPGQAFSGEEMRNLGLFASQFGGLIEPERFARLGRWLLATPRYDNNARAQHDAVPEGSLLRKRKRSPGTVLADLGEQLRLSEQWEVQPEKKERGGGSASGAMLEPEGDWRAFARERLGIDTPLPWALLLPRMKQEISAAWQQQKGGAA